jgi:hypothetical protein
MDAAELAALMARMPSWEEFLVACGITTSERLVGNCHWAATVLRDLLRTRGVPCRLRRGFWHGDDRRESRAGCAFQQHSWVEARPGGIVFTVDPTQWVFTGAEPGIAIAEDDLRYDGEGRLVEEAAARAAGNYEAPDREGDLSPSKLSRRERPLRCSPNATGPYGRRPSFIGPPISIRTEWARPRPGRFRRQSGRRAGPR